VWFAGKDQVYLDMRLIPKDSELWRFDRFEDFLAEGKKFIRQEFSYFLLDHGPTSH
jgi:hypothetical protein